MDFNNLIECLRSGVKPEKIAEAFTNELNKAIDYMEEEKKYKTLMTNVAEAWNIFISAYFDRHEALKNCNLVNFYMIEEDVEPLADVLVKYIPTLVNLSNLIEEMPNEKGKSNNIFDEKSFKEMVGNVLFSNKKLEK